MRMFTNPQSYQPYQNDIQMNYAQRRQSPMMSMSNMQMQSQQQNRQVVTEGYTATNLKDAIRTPPPQDHDKPKMIWGKFTWILFHTMAEQIKEERFQQLRNEIFHIIYTICSNLPCPFCAEHAKEYLAKNNLMRSQTKEELKYELFKFHNVVNARKHFPQFTVEQLNEMYSKAIPKVVIQNFLVQFNSKSKNIKLLADELHRQNISQTLKSWFQLHLPDFNDPSNPIKSSPIPASPF